LYISYSPVQAKSDHSDFGSCTVGIPCKLEDEDEKEIAKMADLATINNLIDQNEAATQELSTQVDHVLEAVTRIEQLIVAVNAKIIPSSQESRTHFEALKTILDNIENAFEGEMEQAKESLSKVHKKAQELESQVDEMTNEMTSQLDELKNHTNEALSAIQSEADSMNTNLEQLTQQAHASESQLDSQESDTNQDIAEYRGVMDEVKSDFKEKTEELTNKLETLETELKSNLETLVEEFDSFKQESTERRTDLESTIDQISDDTNNLLSQQLEDWAPDQISEAGMLMSEVLDELSGIEDIVEKMVGGPVGLILDTIGEIMDTIEPVLQVLEIVEQVLS